MRKTKDLISSLDPFKKRELVQSLETAKDKEKQQRLAIAQRRAAEKAAAQKAGEHSKTVLKAPTKSRAFTDMMAKLEVDDASLDSLDFSVGSWWLTGEAPSPMAYPGSDPWEMNTFVYTYTKTIIRRGPEPSSQARP
jgi:hypothetical protein